MRGDVGRGAKESLFKRAYRSVSDWADRNSVNVYVFDCGVLIFHLIFLVVILSLWE